MNVQGFGCRLHRALCVVLGLWVASVLGARVVRAEGPEAWTCLPDETCLMARVPGAAAFFGALGKQTKLGAIVGAPDRIAKLTDWLTADGQDEIEKLTAELGKYQLKLDDWKRLGAGDAGVALVVEHGVAQGGNGAEGSRLFFLFWFEPEADLSDRLYAALQQALDENRAEEHAAKREDVQIAGFNCMHLTLPGEPEVMAEEAAPAEQPKTRRERRKARLEAEAAAKKKPKAPEDSHFFVTRQGPRWLLAWTSNGALPGAEHDAERREAEADTAACAKFFGEFLAAHREPRPSAFTRLLETPGLANTLPAGLPLIEMLADPRPIVKLVTQTSSANEADPTDTTAQIKRWLAALGLDALGPLAYRVALDGQELRSGGFLSLPAPRTGLMAVLDQTPSAAEVPAWVSNEVVSYEQLTLDLGDLFVRIRELAEAEAGDQARTAFGLLDNQLKTMLQTDPVTLLSSLGRVHSAVSFPPLQQAKKNDEDEQVDMGRTALVWQLQDEALWTKILQLATTFSGQPPALEQGFTGVRLKHENFEGGAFVGRGYLVVANGAGVAETVLGMLRNPPTGDAALRGSPLERRGRELLPARAGLVFQMTDNDRLFKTARQGLEAALNLVKSDNALGLNVDLPGKSKLTPDHLLELIPTEAELERAIGVGVSQTFADEHGITTQSVLELPAP